MEITEDEALTIYLLLKACIVENNIAGARFYMKTRRETLQGAMNFAAKLYDTVPGSFRQLEDKAAPVVVINPYTGVQCEPCECSHCTNNSELITNSEFIGE